MVRNKTAKKIYILGYVSPDELELIYLLKGDTVVTVLDINHAQSIAHNWQKICNGNKTLSVTLALDLRFGREGTLINKLAETISIIKNLPALKLESMYAHYSSADDNLSEESLIQEQLFLQASVQIKENLPTYLHNTAGVIRNHYLIRDHGLFSNINIKAVRIGLGLYGISPMKTGQFDDSLTPVLSWISTIAQVKELPSKYPIGYNCTYWTRRPTTVALVPQGYSDGLDRRMSNQGCVLISGYKCPILGRVSMNMITVDISEIPDVKSGDPVVLIGTQGKETITASAIAKTINSISYEVLAKISPTLPRLVTN